MRVTKLALFALFGVCVLSKTSKASSNPDVEDHELELREEEELVRE